MAEESLTWPRRRWHLQRILAEAALDWRSRRRLKRIVSGARSRHEQYTFENLLAKAESIPPEVLSMILADLVEQGLIERVIRIESPSSRAGLRDCPSPEVIPATIDDVDGRKIAVTRDMLKVVYKF